MHQPQNLKHEYKINDNKDGFVYPHPQVLSGSDNAFGTIVDSSTSNMTALQQTATKNQKWPLLNLVRQVLKGLNYNLIPIRKSDGYDEDGKKKYKRFFVIEPDEWIEICKENKGKSIPYKYLNNSLNSVKRKKIKDKTKWNIKKFKGMYIGQKFYAD